jgi:hypothetical protein
MGLYPNLYTASRVEGVLQCIYQEICCNKFINWCNKQKAAGKGGSLQRNIFNTMSKAMIRKWWRVQQ